MKLASYDSDSNLDQEIQSLIQIREVIPDLSISDTLERYRMLKKKVDSIRDTDVHRLYDLIRNTHWYMEVSDAGLYLEVGEADTDALMALGLVPNKIRDDRFTMPTQDGQSIIEDIYTLRNFYDTPRMILIPEVPVTRIVSSGYTIPH